MVALLLVGCEGGAEGEGEGPPEGVGSVDAGPYTVWWGADGAPVAVGYRPPDQPGVEWWTYTVDAVYQRGGWCEGG